MGRLCLKIYGSDPGMREKGLLWSMQKLMLLRLVGWLQLTILNSMDNKNGACSCSTVCHSSEAGVHQKLCAH